MPNVMAALSNTGGALCSTLQINTVQFALSDSKMCLVL